MKQPIGILFLLSVFSVSATAQQSDPEWPCVQVLIPEIVAGVVWPEMIDPALIGSWKNDPSQVAIVKNLSDIEGFTDKESNLIAEFVESAAQNSSTQTLNQVADGILALSNQRRLRYIKGIKRYTRQQISIAHQIETSLNQLADLEDQSDSANDSQIGEIKETLEWHKRVYDQRERAIQSLCDRPVLAAENLSAVLRELAQYLP